MGPLLELSALYSGGKEIDTNIETERERELLKVLTSANNSDWVVGARGQWKEIQICSRKKSEAAMHA